MEDTLISLLESFKYPVLRQGSLPSDKKYPKTFFTFWNNDESGESFYDNKTSSVLYDYAVNVYSTDPALAYELLRNARALLLNNNWIITDRGFDVASDEITHAGRGMNVMYLELQNI